MWKKKRDSPNVTQHLEDFEGRSGKVERADRETFILEESNLGLIKIKL